MKRRLISVILMISMVIGTTNMAFALNDSNKNDKKFITDKSAYIISEMQGRQKLVDSVAETPSDFIYKSANTDFTAPKMGKDSIEATIGGEYCIKMRLPGEVSKATGVKTRDGSILYNAESGNIDILVQILEDDINGIIFSSMRALLLIENVEAPKKYDFSFNLPDGCRLITSSKYAEMYYPEDHDWIGENLVFIVDRDGNILSTIDEPWAKDANGSDVETFYEVHGNTLTQMIRFTASNAFPIIADPTNTGAKTKIETLTFSNTTADKKKLIQARREVNERQNSTLNTVISLINSVFGLFNLYTGITSMIISGVMGGNNAFLEKCEDTYTEAHEELALHPQYKGGNINFNYRGTYQGKNKGYVYQVQDVAYSNKK